MIIQFEIISHRILPHNIAPHGHFLSHTIIITKGIACQFVDGSKTAAIICIKRITKV